VVDDLAAVFGAGNFTVESLSSDSLTINPSFDGDADKNLLAGVDALGPGDTAVITFDVIFTPPADTVYPLMVTNQATATGVAQGVPVQDLSDDGSDPSPASDNGSGGTGDPTPVVFDAPPIAPPPTEIPTLGEWGLMVLGSMLALLGLRRLRTP